MQGGVEKIGSGRQEKLEVTPVDVGLKEWWGVVAREGRVYHWGSRS